MADQPQRIQKRTESDCTLEDLTLKTEVLPPGRKTNDCDPAAPTPQADPFIPPTPCPPVFADDVLIPVPLPIPNDAITVHCGDSSHAQTTPPHPTVGNDGYSSTITSGYLTEAVNFAFITDITGNQLTYIASLGSTDRNTLANPSTTIAQIVALTGLNVVQAANLQALISTAKTSVNSKALDLALAGILCYYANNEITLYCSPAYPDANSAVTDGDDGTPNLLAAPNTPPDQIPASYIPLANNPVIIPAGSYTSTFSQGDANSLANDAATSALQCLYCNDQRTRTCADLGFTDELVTDSDDTEDALDGRKRKGSVTIVRNSVCSTDSKDDANTLADSLADDQLSCFYVNPQITVDCASVGLQAGIPGVTGPPFGDFLLGLRGQTITIPAGYIVSLVSTDDAVAQAHELAVGMLDCWICNEAQIAQCPPDEVITSSGASIFIDDSVGETVTVAECEIQASTLEEANQQALDQAGTQLNCTYCNPDIPAKCAAIGSIDETIGVPSGTFCCPGTGGGQTCYEIAISTSIPVVISNEGIDCRFCNVEQCAYCDDPERPPVTEGCTAVGGPLCIPENTFCIGQSAGGLDAANQIAHTLAVASLVCLYTNSANITVGTGDTAKTVTANTVISFSCEKIPETINGYNGANGADGSDGADGASAPQTGCEGECLAVYS